MSKSDCGKPDKAWVVLCGFATVLRGGTFEEKQLLAAAAKAAQGEEHTDWSYLGHLWLQAHPDQVAAAGTFGAHKYDDYGWMRTEQGADRYREAAARHALKHFSGLRTDQESGVSHAGHIGWDLLACAYHISQG